MRHRELRETGWNWENWETLGNNRYSFFSADSISFFSSWSCYLLLAVKTKAVSCKCWCNISFLNTVAFPTQQTKKVVSHRVKAYEDRNLALMSDPKICFIMQNIMKTILFYPLILLKYNGFELMSRRDWYMRQIDAELDKVASFWSCFFKFFKSWYFY